MSRAPVDIRLTRRDSFEGLTLAEALAKVDRLAPTFHDQRTTERLKKDIFEKFAKDEEDA